MNTSATISNSIMTRVNKINYAEKHGYFTKHHPLYPEGLNESFNYPFTVGGYLVPALNILTEEKFLDLIQKEYNWNIYQIGTLDFWDEYVEFFGSFNMRDALYTKIDIETLESYGLPECFLETVRVFKHPEEFKWHFESLGSGDYRTTVIVVLCEDCVKLYRRKF